MDVDLVLRAQRGDQEAFAGLAAQTYGRFHRVAYTILRDRELALDAVQAAMLAAWRQLPALRDPQRFDAWAYRLLVNACYAEGRKTRRWMPNILADEGPDVPAPDELTGVADRDQLDRGFRRLPIEQRAVVVLYYYVDLPLERVAEVLGIPAGTARSRLHRAMQTLRAALVADGRPPSPPSTTCSPQASMEVSR